MITNKILIDIKTCRLSLSEVLDYIRKESAKHPECDIFLDGDAHAVVSRRRFNAI